MELKLRRNNVPGKNSLGRVMQVGKLQAVPCVGDNFIWARPVSHVSTYSTTVHDKDHA